jgi:hypothetical protein
VKGEKNVPEVELGELRRTSSFVGILVAEEAVHGEVVLVASRSQVSQRRAPLILPS